MAKKQYTSPYLIFGLLSFFIIGAITFYEAQNISLLFSYLLSINLMTFFLYGYDKLSAIQQWLRVPEYNLQALALLGGSPSALVAQKFFRHKTIKGSFQLLYWGIVILQIIALFFLYQG